MNIKQEHENRGQEKPRSYSDTRRVSHGIIKRQVSILEATTVEVALHIAACLIAGQSPSFLRQAILLISINSQTGTGQGKLQQEEEEQDDHVLGRGLRRNMRMTCQPAENGWASSKDEKIHSPVRPW